MASGPDHRHAQSGSLGLRTEQRDRHVQMRGRLAEFHVFDVGAADQLHLRPGPRRLRVHHVGGQIVQQALRRLGIHSGHHEFRLPKNGSTPLCRPTVDGSGRARRTERPTRSYRSAPTGEPPSRPRWPVGGRISNTFFLPGVGVGSRMHGGTDSRPALRMLGCARRAALTGAALHRGTAAGQAADIRRGLHRLGSIIYSRRRSRVDTPGNPNRRPAHG